MNTISFIKGIAFVVSCIIKLVSLPFLLIYRWIRKRAGGERTANCESRNPFYLIKKIIFFIKNGIKIFFIKLREFLQRLRRFIYWTLRRIYSYLYWKFYYASQKIYQSLIKKAWFEVFFVYLRGYLKPSPESFSSYTIISVEKYARLDDKVVVDIIEPAQSREVCLPEFFEHSEEKVESYISPDIYVALASNVSVIGGSNAVIAGKYLLNDAVAGDKEHRLDIRYASIKAVVNHDVLVEDTDDCIEIDRAINLIGAASFNYYHLVIEILSKLAFVDRNTEYADYPILVDEVVLRIPQFSAALFCMNKTKHAVISVKKGQQYNIGSAVLPSSNVWMPTNVYNRDTIRNSDFLISKTVLNNIRSSVQLYDEKKPFRKIFISRKNTQAVRLKNEETIREIFKNNGFEIIYTEELSFQEQIDCFGQASCVVAASGAALTNIIFCQPGAVIGCIIPEEHRFYMYSTIAHLLGLTPFFLGGEIVEKTPYAAADAFVLDEDYAYRYIKELKNRMKE